jgi:hypothetical protein
MKALATLNCSLLNETNPLACQKEGSLASIGQAPYNVLRVGSSVVSNNIACKNVNIIFVEGTLEISGQVIKDTTVTSGCVFVLASGSNLIISDTPSDARTYTRTPPPSGEIGVPTTDRFDAAIIANSGATVQTKFGARGATTKSTDWLRITGWVYSANTVPTFKRNLAPVDNKQYPAEWIVYDASLLDSLRPMLGLEKTVDLTCGTSEHVLCNSQQ